MNLDALLQRTDLWRGSEALSRGSHHHVATGHPPLDKVLPGGGWPLGALSELLFIREGVGELQLVMPALRNSTDEKHWQVWIGRLPYAPALAAAGLDLSRQIFVETDHVNSLWAMEQALRSGTCSAVLGWLTGRLQERELRRLQLAAEEGNSLAFLFRPGPPPRSSPAALRLQLSGIASGLEVRILKCRGGWAQGPIQLLHRALA